MDQKILLICSIFFVYLQLAEEGGHLAPHGVPGSHMPRALSGQNINEEESQMLGQEAIPGKTIESNNPFLQPFDPPDRLWTPQQQ